MFRFGKAGKLAGILIIAGAAFAVMTLLLLAILGVAVISPGTPGITVPAANANVSSSLINWTASGDLLNGSLNYTVFVNGSFNGTTPNTNLTLNMTSERRYVVNVSAFNGSNSSDNATVTFDFDNIPPRILNGSNSVLGGFQSLNYAMINITFTEPYNDTAYILNGTATTGLTNTSPNMTSAYFWFNFTGLADANYTFSGWMNDSAGNVNMTTGVNVTVDTTSPTLNFSVGSNSNNSLLDHNYITLNISVNELYGFNITAHLINGTNVTVVNYTLNTSPSWNSIIFAGLANDKYNVTVTASDKVLNKNSSSLSFVVDTIPAAKPAKVNFTPTNGGNVMINWTDAAGESGESYVIFRSLINISSVLNNLTNYSGINDLSNVTNLTALSRVAEGVQSFVDNSTLNQSIYFYAVAAVDVAGNLQNSSFGVNVSNSYNVTVNDTVMPMSTLNITLTTSDTSVTITWLNVTRDVAGSPDFYGLTYNIYRSSANATANLSMGNVTAANMTLVKSVTGPANSTTISGLVKGTYHFAVTTIDDGGNENLTLFIPTIGPFGNYGNISVTPTVSSSSSSSSGGGGGGGGGGGAAAPPVGTSISRSWDVLPTGPATVKITKDDFSFKTIDFNVLNSNAAVQLTVTKLDTKPVMQREVQGTVYQYIRVDETNLKEADISDVKIAFKIEKKWMDQYNGSIKDVVLQRYLSNIWTNLDTTFTRTDATYNYFEADSPGLSLFAVALKAAPSPVVPTAVTNASSNATQPALNASQEAAAQQEQAAVKTAKSKNTIIMVIVLVIVALAIGGFVMVRKKGGGSFNFSIPNIPNPLKKFGRGGGGSGVRPNLGSKSKQEEEAAEIVKEYESKERGRPPEAFN